MHLLCNLFPPDLDVPQWKLFRTACASVDLNKQFDTETFVGWLCHSSMAYAILVPVITLELLPTSYGDNAFPLGIYLVATVQLVG